MSNRRTSSTRGDEGSNNEYVKSDKQKKKSNKFTRNSRKTNKVGTDRNSNMNQADLNESGRNNKPGYYFVSKEMAEQATQLSFNNVLGYGSISGYKVPTIMRLDLVAGPGCTYDVDSSSGDDFMFVPSGDSPALLVNPGKAGVNIMASKLYTLMSSFTGRTASYAPQDVAMMILAIAAIAEYSEAIRRIFGLALTYNYWNRTLAEGILRTMKINVEDFFANISIYRMQFNVAISRINQIPLLDNIAYIQKSREIYQEIYYDDPTNMAQIFYYMPKTWAYLDEETSETGTVLRHVNHAKGSADDWEVTVGEMIDNLNVQITKVLESSTLNFIYADLLNMANKIKTPMWKFDYLAENYTVLPQYNANACLQLHNLTITGRSQYPVPDSYDTYAPEALPKRVEVEPGIFVTEGYDVFCDTDQNNIIYNPGLYFSSAYARHKTNIIDMLTDKPTLEDKIESLRFMSAWSGYYYKDVNNNYVQMFTALPDHYCVCMNIWNNVTSVVPDYYTFGTYGANSVGRFQEFSPITQWEHAPLMKILSLDASKVEYILGDLTFYTTVDFEYIKRLLNATYVGLFEFRV